MIGYIIVPLLLLVIASIPGKSNEQNKAEGKCSCGAHYITHHRCLTKEEREEEGYITNMLDCACCGDSLDI